MQGSAVRGRVLPARGAPPDRVFLHASGLSRKSKRSCSNGANRNRITCPCVSYGPKGGCNPGSDIWALVAGLRH